MVWAVDRAVWALERGAAWDADVTSAYAGNPHIRRTRLVIAALTLVVLTAVAALYAD